jgi:hypothetical protein
VGEETTMTDQEFADYLRSVRGKRLTEPDSLDGQVDAALERASEAARDSYEQEILYGKKDR